MFGDKSRHEQHIDDKLSVAFARTHFWATLKLASSASKTVRECSTPREQQSKSFEERATTALIMGILEWVGDCDEMTRFKQHSRVPI